MDPQTIYTGEEGFDMKYSKDGMWGRGLYFAQNAKYSDPYGYLSVLDLNDSFLWSSKRSNARNMQP
jgi:hypothetical protein